jgi:hypothetical protein
LSYRKNYSEEEYSQLEENIQKDGCRDPLVLWNNTLVDGHNRYGICTKHGIPFKTIEREFDSTEDARVWIIQNQFGRRNLVPFVRAELALKLEEIFKQRAKENNITEAHSFKNLSKNEPLPLPNLANPTGNKIEPLSVDNQVNKIDTREEISKVSGISHGNIDKVKKIVEKAPEEIKQKLRSGDISINQAHKVVSMVQNDDKKDEISKKL